MSRWPIIGKSRTAMAVLLVLSCMLLFQAGSAEEPCAGTCTDSDPDIMNVTLNVGCNYEFCIDFESQPRMTAGSNFYVFFDDKVKIDPNLNKDCIVISWDSHTAKPTKVEVFTKDNLPIFAPECANGAVKIWVPQDIEGNSDVTICFNCGLSCPQEVPCPFQNCVPCEPCQNFIVWVANDLTRCPVISTQYVKVIASAGTGGFVMYPPNGDSAAPDFDTYFKYGSTPTYLIKGDSYVIDTIYITSLCDNKTTSIVYRNGTVQATYTFDPLECPYMIRATFLKEPVYAYLKYQLPQSECGAIVKVKVWGSDSDECKDCGYVPVKDKIQPVLNFTDDLYMGGNTAKFEVYGWKSGFSYGSYDGIYTDNVTPAAKGDTLLVKVTSNPTTNPETYNVSYIDAAGTQHATVTILKNGQWIWAPELPKGVTDITSITVDTHAWQMVTQDYLNCHPDFEGLIGMVVEADDSKVYTETVEIDTPGVLLKNKDGAKPVIDAKGLTPKGDYPKGKSGAVFLSAGCTGIEGFKIMNSITNGVLVNLTSPKCKDATIHDCKECGEGLNCNLLVPCCRGRINIVKNDIVNNCENGIYVNDAVILITENEIHDNFDDGIDAGCLFCGVECIDPKSITPKAAFDDACSEIVYNKIYHNGHFSEFGAGVTPKGEWEVKNLTDGKMYFTSDPKGGCNPLPGWTDAGIQIRCVGSATHDGKTCGEPCQGEKPKQCIDCRGSKVVPSFDEGQCSSGSCFSGGCTGGSCSMPLQQNGVMDCGGCNQTLYIEYNNVYSNYHANVYLMENATQGGEIIIQSNDLKGNQISIFGLLTEAAIPSRIDFKWNNMECNKYWGVKNLAPCPLNATENWWGSAGGPSAGPAPIVQCIDCRCHEIDQRSEALGNGNGVSHRVNYNPWLYVPSQCIDGSCYKTRMFGSDTLKLQCGWNTLSVPVRLADNYDSLPEIGTLGKFISKENCVWVLRWDAKNDIWVPTYANGESIIPGRGYLIKMKTDSRFPVLYYSNEAMPNSNDIGGLTVVPLESGWNLIGSTWGIDRDDSIGPGSWGIASPELGDDEAFKEVSVALESIKEGQNGGKGVAIIVNTPVSGQYTDPINPWTSASVVSGFWDPVKNKERMVTGDAYWVFMVNPGFYAGFDATPITFNA